MTDIVISKVNESFVKIACDRSIAREIQDQFTFMVPGYQFTPAFKNKYWDGKIKLFRLNDNTMYYGLVPKIKEFCEENNYSYEIRDGIDDTDDFSRYYADKFTSSLNLQDNGKAINIKEHQTLALIHAMRHKRALLLSPTASGKSLIMYTIIRQLLDYHKLKGLIIVPEISLAHQLKGEFINYSSDNGFDVESNIHLVFAGQDKNTEKNITISTYQSIHKLDESYFSHFDFVLIDEAHTVKSDSITKILTNCVNAKYRIGLTGTLDGTKTHQWVIEGLTGIVYSVTTTSELISEGTLSDLEIKCLVLKHPDNICIENKKTTYDDEVKYLCSNERRNKFIRNLALSLKNNTLILYRYIDHGKILNELITKAEKLNGRKVYFINGNVDVDDREEIRKILETDTDAILIASFGVFSQGNNVKNLHNIIFAASYKAQIKTLQSIGRGLRLHSSKDVATLFDITDDLRTHYKNGKVSYTNHTLRHFTERIGIYSRQKFKFKMYKIGL